MGSARSRDGAKLEQAVQSLTEVLLAVAQGDFSVRAERSYQGDPVDVLAFLVNATADEVGDLVRQLQDERRELARTQDQLLITAKLASLGELAAGVAHELNQPLTAMRILVDLLSAQPGVTIEESLTDLDTLAEAVRRMGRIVDGIRTFGRAAPIEVRPIPALFPIEGALDLVQDTLERDGIVVDRDFAVPLPEIDGDADQLHQVFVNLLLNARDALKQRERDGRVVVRARCIPDGVSYHVEDNGPGIREEVARRIFDPFFSTKPVGEGTGLGLALSHGIVAEHGGVLRYEPGRNGGACFVVELSRRERSDGADG